MVKGFNFSIQYVLYEISYVNVLMYGAVLPDRDYNNSKNKKEDSEIIDANDPNNIERIRQFILDSE